MLRHYVPAPAKSRPITVDDGRPGSSLNIYHGILFGGNKWVRTTDLHDVNVTL